MSNKKEQQLEQTRVIELLVPNGVCSNFVKDAMHFGSVFNDGEFAGIEMDAIRDSFGSLIAQMVNKEGIRMEYVALAMLSAAASVALQSGRFDAQSFAQESLVQFNRFDVLLGDGWDVTIN